MFTHPLPYFSILAFAYKSLKKFYHAEIFRKKAFWSKDFLSEIRMLDVCTNRIGDGFQELGGHSANQEALEVILLGSCGGSVSPSIPQNF